MATILVYNIKGEEAGKINLPDDIFNVEISNDLIYQAVLIQRTNSRTNLAHTKNRGEVRGGGKKPWRQKGTGRARHGSIRSPIWVGGGITFGPRKERKFSKKINKKAKRKALFMVLSSKVKDKELVVLDKLELKEPKTKLMVNLINKIFQKEKEPSVLVAINKNKNIIIANKNIPYTKTISADSLNVLDLLSFKYLLLDKESIKLIKNTYLKKPKAQSSNVK